MAKKKTALDLLVERDELARKAAAEYRESKDQDKSPKRKMFRIGPDQHDKARKLAAWLGITMQELFERLVDDAYDKQFPAK